MSTQDENEIKKILEEIEELHTKICNKTGLRREDIFNSIYLVGKRNKLNSNLSIDEKVEKIISDLGIKGNTRCRYDSYYGMLIDYAWHGGSTPEGAEFSPINYRIDNLCSLFPEDTPLLDAFKRRLKYLVFLSYEIQYIEERYDFDKIPLLLEWLTNKFEKFTTYLTELSLLIVEYHVQKITGKENFRIRFEDLINEIIKVNELFRDINSTVEGFIAITIRNNVVHSAGFPLQRKDSHNYVVFEKEEIKQNFGILEAYVKDVYSLFYNGKISPNSWIGIPDQRFPYLTINCKVTKKGTIDWPKTTISLSIELGEYLKIMRGFIFTLSKILFENILKEKQNSTSMLSE